MHPRSKHWHLIDYVIVRRTDRQDVKVTKTMCGADCWTDHRLVVSKLNLRIQPARRPQGKKAPKRLDVSKLNKDSMRQDFLTDICNQLDAMNLSSEDPEENWTVFHKTVLSSAASTLDLGILTNEDTARMSTFLWNYFCDSVQSFYFTVFAKGSGNYGQTFYARGDTNTNYLHKISIMAISDCIPLYFVYELASGLNYPCKYILTQRANATVV